MAFNPMIFSGFSLMQTDPGDTRFNHYLLEHSYRWITSAMPFDQFWNPGFFYPVKNTLAFSDILLSVAPFYWIWRLLGFSPEPALQAWTLLMCVANYVAFYFFLRKWFCKKQIAASVGAFLFAFASSRINQLGHQQLIPQFYPLLSIHALMQLFLDKETIANRRKTRLCISVFALSAVLQFYAAFYYAWFLAFTLIVAAFWSLVFKATREKLFNFVSSYWLFLAANLVLSFVLLAPLFVHYLRAAADVGLRPYSAIIDQLPPIQAWFYSGKWNLLYFWEAKIKIFRMIVAEHEHRLGLGLFTTALLVIGFLKARRTVEFKKTISIFILTGLTIIVLISQIRGHSLWYYVFNWFPGASSIRAYSRLGVFLLPFFALGPALYFEFNSFNKYAISAMLPLVLVISEQLVKTEAYDWKSIRQELTALKSKLSPDCRIFFYSPVLASNGFPHSWKYQVDAMWIQIETGIPTINGYSGNFPPRWGLFDALIDSPKKEAELARNISDWIENKALKPESVCWLKPRTDQLK